MVQKIEANGCASGGLGRVGRCGRELRTAERLACSCAEEGREKHGQRAPGPPRCRVEPGEEENLQRGRPLQRSGTQWIRNCCTVNGECH